MRFRLFLALTPAMVGAVLVTESTASAVGPSVFINEIHYDNTGTDTSEGVEIAGPAGTDLSGWSVVLYNGSGGAAYDTIALTGTLPDQQAGFGTLGFPRAGIQNGSPDGLALVDDGGTVVEFLSYEGSFVAAGGPADVLTSTDIGVSEASSAAVGDSLQLTGNGTRGGDFAWAGPQPSTFGAINTGQTFGGGGNEPQAVINEFSASTAGADVEYVEIFGTPSADLSNLTVLEIEGDFNGTATGSIEEVIPVGTLDASGFGLISLPANSFENGTITLLLVDGFAGTLGDDLDTNDDGVLEVTPWASIVDAVAVDDGGASDLTYGTPVLGPNYDGLSSFAPGGASRIPDGVDTDTAADWVRNDFDLFGIPGFAGSPAPGEAENTPGATNVEITVVTDPLGACGDAATKIYDIQGSGLASPDVGSIREIEGVVVGDFQNNGSPDNGDLNGFHVQDPTGDGDPATSDGIFVYAPGGIDVAIGDGVRVRGAVSEFNGLTELTAAAISICSTGNTVAPTALSLPVTSVDDFEAFEGMSVTFPQDLVISEYFNFDRFGEIVLTSRRHLTPTAEFEPGPDAIQAAQDFLLDRITLDDGRTNQNPDPAIHPNGAVLDLTNLFRGGDTVANVTGVMDYSFGLYRIQPTQGADSTNANPRTASPDPIGGSVTVSNFNVLNYFTTIDTGAFICGPLADQECRGADDVTELTRQRDKIVAAIGAIDADVVGLTEIENGVGDGPTADLVAGLNAVAGAGTYDYIATGAIGGDAIRVALIYQPASVTPSGAFAVLDSTVDPRFVDTKSRPVLAQTFVENATGATFTVAVNHFKSKGSDCNDLGDPDLGDGAGNCNVTRTLAAEALVDWLATDPTGSGDPDVLIIGDLNSYDKEDPIDALRAGGFEDLVAAYQGEDAYSYVFDGQIGYLDYQLANGTLAPQVTGATVWHINADEPDLIDYDTSFKRPAQDAIYAPDPYRSSDHDPVIVGLDLDAPPVCAAAVPSIDRIWPPNHKMVDVHVLGVTDPEGGAVTITVDAIFQDEPVEGAGDGNTAPDGEGVGTSTAQVRAERSGSGDGRAYHIAYTARDGAGNRCSGEVVVTVPTSKKGAVVDGGALYDSTIG